jgi:UDP-glucose 4-epimerase
MMILVTGGAGFIGSHTVDLLVAQGRRVRILDDLSSGRREHLPASALVELIEGDVRDPGAVGSVMRGVTKVLHLAAHVSVVKSVEDPLSSGAVNVGGFLVVLDAARRAGVGRFVYASSAAVYGAPEHVPVDESAAVTPQSPYGLEKSIDDQYAALFEQLYDLKSLGLRYFNVYGPRQDPASPYAGVISRFLDCIRTGRPLPILGDGEQTRDFVFVEDIARLNVLALDTTSRGVCNVGTGRSVSLLELVRLLEELVERPLPTRCEAARPGDIRHSTASTARLQQLFGGLRPADLREGLRALLNAERIIH